MAPVEGRNIRNKCFSTLLAVIFAVTILQLFTLVLFGRNFCNLIMYFCISANKCWAFSLGDAFYSTQNFKSLHDVPFLQLLFVKNLRTECTSWLCFSLYLRTKFWFNVNFANKIKLLHYEVYWQQWYPNTSLPIKKKKISVVVVFIQQKLSLFYSLLFLYIYLKKILQKCRVLKLLLCCCIMYTVNVASYFIKIPFQHCNSFISLHWAVARQVVWFVVGLVLFE